MKVLDVMNKKVVTIKKDTSILDAMKVMRERNVGFLIIEEDNEALGIITDRDIVLILSKEISINTQVHKVMKKYVITIDEESEASIASDMMGYMQIRRLVVINKDNKIRGVISLSDLASTSQTEELALEALIEISYNYPTNTDEVDKFLQVSAYIF